jgi:hypothetical protein
LPVARSTNPARRLQRQELEAGVTAVEHSAEVREYLKSK